ncbi:hypothetical protein ARMGADRAFT_1166015 [Armillaria gallica]|uniref:Uncharacterized protein n=1 Tax=Armillaria gallica TaxID=47427 RepID=A0A2H3DLR3_ARMGA|nr:hypothetical protein ARMGADRAFT_1166015 [Armillaria gallica]
MSSPLPIPIADISSRLGATFGAIFIGATKAAVLCRIQTVICYKQNPNDPWLFRYAVAFLWIFDTLHVALSTHTLYFYLIESFGNYLSLLLLGIVCFPVTLSPRCVGLYEPKALPLSCSYCSIQYAVRIWKLGRHFHVMLPRFIFLAVVATLGTGTYVIYDTYTLSSFMDVSTIKASIYADFSTTAGADFVIAGLSFILRSMNVLMQLIKYYQHNFETNVTRSDIWAGDERMLPLYSRDVHCLAGHSRFRWNRLHLAKALYKFSTRHAQLTPEFDQKIIRFLPPKLLEVGWLIQHGRLSLSPVSP